MTDSTSRTAGLRAFNRARILDAVRSGQADSRVELARVTGLARTTIASLVAELVEDGQLAEQPAEDGRRSVGRPPLRLRPVALVGSVVGIDFGHSHVTVGVAGLDARPLTSRTEPVDVDASPDAALAEAARCVGLVLDEAGVRADQVRAAVLGLPAPVDVTDGRVRASNILPAWLHRRPGEELARLTGLDVQVENDANLGALGEAHVGAARGLRDVVYVKVATGIGSGLILDGRLYRGARGTAGEIGHQQVVESTGAVCRCGNRGCLETVVSTTALPRLLEPTHGPGMTLARVLELVAAGDVGATRLVIDAGRMIGRVAATVCNALDPAALVIGGELGLAGDPLLSGVRDSLDRYGEPELVRTLQVRAGELGARAELLGALALAASTTVNYAENRS